MRIVRSAPPEITRLPEMYFTHNTPSPMLAAILLSQLSFSTFQILISLSKLAEAILEPSGLQLTELIRLLCPGRKPTTRTPVSASKSLTIPDVYPTVKWILSGHQSTLSAPASSPHSMRSHSFVDTFQIRMDLSVEAEANRLSSALIEMDLTSLVWPLRSAWHNPVFVHQRRIIWSLAAVYNVLSSFDQAISQTASLWGNSKILPPVLSR